MGHEKVWRRTEMNVTMHALEHGQTLVLKSHC